MAYGGILGQTSAGGKKVCRLVVGTSTSGWTANDCDYLCDGTADNVEINAAIQALPSTGGEIIILDGTYNITATIAMNKDNVKLSGNGAATVLKRMWNSSVSEGVITVTAANGGCCIESFCIDGNKAAYNSTNDYGIYLSNSNNNTVTGNTCNNNRDGIYLSNSNNNTVTGNTCNNNNYHGIYLSNSSSNNTVTGNTCNNNNNYGIRISNNSNNNTVTGNTCNNNTCGIYLASNSNNTVTGNTCIRGTGQASDYTSSQYTIWLSGTGNNYNLIACNNIMGKNYTSEGGTSNTFVNNKYN